MVVQISAWIPDECLAKTNKTHTILNVRVGVHPDKTRLVVEVTGKIPFQTVQTFKARYHEIILGNITSKSSLLKLHKGQGLIQNYRFESENSSIMRLKINTKAAARISQIFLIPNLGKAPGRLVIDMKKVQ
ncbi:MAG: hypothetical protein IBJ00_03440, partial [Alphaproteobacteria bacterium]|nr:hypothetical protein [Alphaproteobacteria bacterium]